MHSQNIFLKDDYVHATPANTLQKTCVQTLRASFTTETLVAIGGGQEKGRSLFL